MKFIDATILIIAAKLSKLKKDYRYERIRSPVVEQVVISSVFFAYSFLQYGIITYDDITHSVLVPTTDPFLREQTWRSWSIIDFYNFSFHWKIYKLSKQLVVESSSTAHVHPGPWQIQPS